MDIKAAFEPETILEAGAQLTPKQRRAVDSFALNELERYIRGEEGSRGMLDAARSTVIRSFEAGMTFAVNELAEHGYGPQEEPQVEVSMPLSEFVGYTHWLRDQVDELRTALNELEAQ